MVTRSFSTTYLTTVTDTATTTTTRTVTASCTARPSSKVTRIVPKDYTWGCAPGYICSPKNKSCDTEPPPDTGYQCEPDECVVAPPLCEQPDNWGDSPQSDKIGTILLQPPYYPLDPTLFGLTTDIFVSLQKRGSVVEHPISRRQSSEFSVCYNECEGANRAAQSLGKTARLCAAGSAFKVALARCQECFTFFATSTSTSQQALAVTVEPTYQQYVEYCNQNFPDGSSSSASVVGTSTSATAASAAASSSVAVSGIFLFWHCSGAGLGFAY
jgi:hypothetical protein